MDPKEALEYRMTDDSATGNRSTGA